MPFNTDITALAPTITLPPGASVSPASGEKKDFTNPVTYTVTAEDGTKQTYTVTVTKGPAPKSTAKEIKSFVFKAFTPTISATIDSTAKTITATLPATADLTKLTPEIAFSAKASVSPASGVVQDFSKDVTYTVTAEDGSTKAFVVSVKKEAVVAIKLLPRNIIDTLRGLGVDIIEAGRPIKVEGIYEVKPAILLGSNVADEEIGGEFEPLRLHFYDQSSSDQSLKIRIKNGETTGSGIGGFITGESDKFTAFFETTVLDGVASAKSFVVISGQWSSNGIRNIKFGLYLSEKNDPNGDFAAIGTSRVFKDGDGLSNIVNSLRIQADEVKLPMASIQLKSVFTK